MSRPTDRSLFYDRLAAGADWDEATNPFETQRRLELVFDDVLAAVDLSDLDLLDAGSGGGHFSAAAGARGARVTSLDVGESLLAQVAARCDSRRVLGSVLDLPFSDASFDLVLCTEVIEHTPDPGRALVELARVVRPGGRLIVTSPGRLWQPVVRLATRLGLRPYEGYENFLWPISARRILTSAGVRIDRIDGFNLLPFFNRRLVAWHHRLDGWGAVAPWLYVNFLIVGQRA